MSTFTMSKTKDFGSERKERLDTSGSEGSNSPSLYYQPPNLPTPTPLTQAETLREHGAPIDHDVPQAKVKPANPDLWWSRVRNVMIEPFSEFFGVFILILFGDGVVAQVVLSSGAKGDYQSISWGKFHSTNPLLLCII
jgi:aquaglyceroporin related protein